MAIALCSALGHRIASCYVEARHNLGAVFGGIFGILAAFTVSRFIESPALGVISLIGTFSYTTFTVGLQRLLIATERKNENC